MVENGVLMRQIGVYRSEVSVLEKEQSGWKGVDDRLGGIEKGSDGI